jgi:hypothetical protein
MTGRAMCEVAWLDEWGGEEGEEGHLLCTPLYQHHLFEDVEQLLLESCVCACMFILKQLGASLGLARTVYIHRMTEYLVISLPKTPYIHLIYVVLANPNDPRHVIFEPESCRIPLARRRLTATRYT